MSSARQRPLPQLAPRGGPSAPEDSGPIDVDIDVTIDVDVIIHVIIDVDVIVDVITY